MSDYERLRRGSRRRDASSTDIRQGTEDLSRGSYHPDAVARAAQQEEEDEVYEQVQHTRVREGGTLQDRSRRRSASRDAYAGDTSATRIHDNTGNTVLRRPAGTSPQRPTPQSSGSGGAVVSRRSGLAMWMDRRMRGVRSAYQAGSAAVGERLGSRGRGASRGIRIPHPHSGLLRVLMPLIVVLTALYLVFCLPIDRAISLSGEEREGLSSELSWHVPGMPYYLLALGSDAREGDTVSRTDTMILVRVDPLGGKLTMLSIPRDTKVEIEGYGTQKINAAYAFGGAAGAVRAVRDLTGVPISQVALVRFDGLEGLVDALGGVTVDVPVDVYDPNYTGLVLPAGEQQMDGHTALLFSRVRHGFDLGDYQRQKDQRIVLEAIMRKTLSTAPWKLPGVISQMGGLVGTTMRMYSIVPLMARMKLGNTVYQATAPSDSAMIDGVSYVLVDEVALAEMMDVIDSGGDPETLS